MYLKNILLSIVACLSAAVAVPAQAKGWQCVTYARTITDVSIRGNANTWWGQAAGRYDRGNTPQPGAVLAFKSAPGMRAGHVAVVREVLSPRELHIDHANWTRRGRVEHDARAIDVSEAGDWSAVKVTFGSTLGTRTNPTYGFIYPGTTVAVPSADAKPLLGSDILTLAAAESDSTR